MSGPSADLLDPTPSGGDAAGTTAGAKPVLDPKLRRLLSAGALATSLIVVIAAVALYRRGSHTVGIPADPTDAQAKANCVLVQVDGNARVRCARLVDTHALDVWYTIIDYKRFPGIFDSALWTMRFNAVDESTTRTHIVGNITSVVGTWPIDVVMSHTSTATGEAFRASWDSSSGQEINRGAWTVRRVEDRAVLIYEIEVRSHKSPAFLINNVLLDQVSKILDAVAAEALKRPPPQVLPLP